MAEPPDPRPPFIDLSRKRPGPRWVADAWQVARIVRDDAGLSAREIAYVLNLRFAADAHADPNRGWAPRSPRHVDGRYVRRCIYVARRWLGIPICAKPGGDGYWLPTSLAQATGYADQCRRFGRDMFALAALVLGRADLATGDAAALPLDEIDRLAPAEAAWADARARVEEALGGGRMDGAVDRERGACGADAGAEQGERNELAPAEATASPGPDATV